MKRYMMQKPAAGFNALPFVSVSEVANDAKLPEGAVLVADDTPLCDWTEAHGGFVMPTPKEEAASVATEKEETT